MLNIEQARAAVLAAVTPLPSEDVAVEGALGRVLAGAVVSRRDAPPFANSAMDGFAVHAGAAGRRLRIVGESRAGTPSPASVAEGEAVRISTGAMTPQGADAVIMVERTQEHPDGTVELHAATTPGQNLRAAGEDLRAGSTVLLPGTRLTPAALGVAVEAGAAHLRCARVPVVAVVSTGDELRAPGTDLGPGQIYDSNALTLTALAAADGARVIAPVHVGDDRPGTERAIATALEAADVLITTGGVSVGPHDHVKPALAGQGVDERFWRVALRPGKPTWFGTREERLVFGLPGNPVSAMVTFLLFVRPALAALQGADPQARRARATLSQAHPRTPSRDEMVRVRLEGDRAVPTGPQGSHQLTSMLGADGLAVIPAGDGELAAGSPVDVELL